MGLDTVGCGDFISQFIYHLDRHNILLLPKDKTGSVYGIFNWKYNIGGVSKIPKPIHHAAFNQITNISTSLDVFTTSLLEPNMLERLGLPALPEGLEILEHT
ncbi:hypothetical protein N7536_002410 [Penicillium majusculum]|nr:hypothetical protein N7536_002410 [Penicillium majusculum]